MGEAVSRFIAIILLLAVTAVSMYCAELIVHNLWDSTAEIRSVLTFVWYSVILVVIVLFLGVLNFGGNRLHILIYTALIALIITSVLVLALPYSMIGRQVSKKIIFVMFGEMAILIPLWLLISQRIYFRFCPPVKTIFITDLPTEDWVVDVVNHFSKRYTIVDTVSPKSVEIAEKIQSVPAVVIGSLVNEDKQRILCICAAYNKSVLMRPEYTDIMMTKAQTEQCDDLLLILVHSFGLTRSQRLGKRIFDIVFSALALTVALPIILICALFIFLEDKHSPFYMQERLTMNKRPYHIIKLRTMIPDAESKKGPALAEKDDPRITKVGRILRKMRLDELPQLINVLLGDMSIVGPRPERAFFYEQIQSELPEFEQRLTVKSGITGYAQIYGRYTTSPRKKLMFDLMYIKHYSFALDLKLLLETFLVLFKRDSSTGVDEAAFAQKNSNGKSRRNHLDMDQRLQ